MFDRATKHPNASIVSWGSPRVLLIKDFLSPQEVEHLVERATGKHTAQRRAACMHACSMHAKQAFHTSRGSRAPGIAAILAAAVS